MEQKKISNSSRKGARSALVFFVAFVVLVVGGVSVWQFRERCIADLENSIEQEVFYKVRLLEQSVELANTKIKLMASAVQSPKDIPSLNKDSFFDSLFFINGDGNFSDNLEEFDFSGEGFFREAMSGKTVMRTSLHSSGSMQALMNFYSPISVNDSIVGVLGGSVGGRTRIRNFLDSTLNGNSVIEILCDSKFDVIVSSFGSVDHGIPMKSKMPAHLAQQTMELLRKNALVDGIPVFKVKVGGDAAIGSIDQVGNTGWFFVVFVTHETISEISTMTYILSTCLVVFILALIALADFMMKRFNRIAQSESEVHLQNVLSALAQSYGSIFEVNLETGELRFIRLANNLVQIAGNLFNRGAKYGEIMAIYVNRVVYSEDKGIFNQVKTLDDVRASFAQRNQFDFIFRTPLKDDSDFHYIQALFVKPMKARPEFVMAFKGVDDTMEAELRKRKNLSEQRKILESALEKAQLADSAKSKFLFNMSHDIRTPMNAVLGYDTLAQQYLWELGLPPEQTEKIARCLNNIQLSGKQLLGLINSVLNMARIESGELSLDESTTLLAELTKEVSITFEETAHEKNVMLLVSRNFKHKYIRCDKIKMQQVILNVVSNAIKFTQSAGMVKINFREEPHENEGWCYIVTTVEDNGVGISEEFLPHIFEDFERERNATVSGVSGTGLGLSIVKKYMDVMKGSINITSKLGEGTKVVLKTPHCVVVNDPSVAVETYPIYREKLTGKRILLVEDNKMNREIAEEMLKSFGVLVECAEDGVQCLEMLEREAAGYYDLILMDIQMPRMDGYEATIAIRSLKDPLKANILIYALTANAFEEDQRESVRVGMNGHISKPVDFTKFYNLLKSLFC